MIKSVAMQAYKNAMQDAQELSQQVRSTTQRKKPVEGFGETLTDSLSKVNEMQGEKSRMIEEFASGKTQNVHELMISMQKAGVAMQMTSAVRGKIISAYQEIMRMPF
ncbi:flagellar hook-basal body complex protein FliE [Paucidesulfovibrio gracilis DSM 16080]|uniref:Flagellar hook-basal body complex protein FliE n=2 Tax=Paucidesulfovibrio TaxID=2910985 RepID=A0A1T4W275_9BACT|nr:flagellar hook-basal body complex protein FliE [Paucidesulfovibrio gracilis DSM 16080]